jgi:nifR3 family TIM-barrel protein
MAGVTNYPYRKICREFGAGLCVSEMVSCLGLLEGGMRTWKIAQFGPDENPRSIQIFGRDPAKVGEATTRLRENLGVDHIDINFGCPVPKMLSKGLGAAAVVDGVNFRRTVHAVVKAAGSVPVSIKVRLGIDEEHFTFREAGRVAEGEGCAYIALHARTARQMYSGKSRWEYVGELKQAVGIPVLGNGDIFQPADALRRMEETGCDGVVIGRGCLGNPWLFRNLKRAFEGGGPPEYPSIQERIEVIRRHFALLLEYHSDYPRLAALSMRKFGAWYMRGLHGAAALRRDFQSIRNESDLESILSRMPEAETS